MDRDRKRTSTSRGKEGKQGRTEHREGDAKHLRCGADPEEGRRPPQRERAGRRHPHREPQRQRLPEAHQRDPRAAVGAWTLGGRRIGIGIGGGRAAPGPRRDAADRGGGAKAEAGEGRRGRGGLEAAAGSKEAAAGEGYRGGGSRRRGAEVTRSVEELLSSSLLNGSRPELIRNRMVQIVPWPDPTVAD